MDNANTTTCRVCDFLPQPGAAWGYLDSGDYRCEHVTGERKCPACLEHWWQPGNDDTHEGEQVGERWVPSCLAEKCPACVAADATPAPVEETPTVPVPVQTNAELVFGDEEERGPTFDDQWEMMTEAERAQYRHDNGPGFGW